MKYHRMYSSIRIYTYIKSLCCTPKTKMMSYVHYLSVKLGGKHHDDMWSSPESPPLRCRFHKHVLQLPSMFHDLSSNWRGCGQRPQAASGWPPPCGPTSRLPVSSGFLRQGAFPPTPLRPQHLRPHSSHSEVPTPYQQAQALGPGCLYF